MRSWIKDRWKKSRGGAKKLWAALYNLLGRNRFNIMGKENHIVKTCLMLNVIVDIRGNGNSIQFGENCEIRNTLIRIRGDNHKIVFGSDCTYQGGQIWIEDHNCTLTVGDGTTVVEASIAVTEPGSTISIGEGCMFAHGIELRCGDSHSIIDLKTGKRINYAKDIRIGNHVWIAADAMILKGVEIDDDCVVASRALVTKSFPKNSLIGGSPAAVLKEKITWDRKRIDDRQEAK